MMMMLLLLLSSKCLLKGELINGSVLFSFFMYYYLLMIDIAPNCETPGQNLGASNVFLQSKLEFISMTTYAKFNLSLYHVDYWDKTSIAQFLSASSFVLQSKLEFHFNDNLCQCLI